MTTRAPRVAMPPSSRTRVDDDDDDVICLDATDDGRGDDDSLVEESDDEEGRADARTRNDGDDHGRTERVEVGVRLARVEGSMGTRRGAAASRSGEEEKEEEERDARSESEDTGWDDVNHRWKRKRWSRESMEARGWWMDRERVRRAAPKNVRANEEDDGFEISDGDVSEHSESSHDRARREIVQGVGRGNERFGKERVSAADGGRQGGGGASCESDRWFRTRMSAMKTMPTTRRSRRLDASRCANHRARAMFRTRHRESAAAAPLPNSVRRVIARASPATNAHVRGDQQDVSRRWAEDQPRITSVFSKAPAPWNFDHRAFGGRRRAGVRDVLPPVDIDG